MYENVLTDILQYIDDEFREIDSPAFTADSHVKNDINMESVEIMEMIGELEYRYKISIPDDFLPRMLTVRDIAREVVSLIEEKE